MTEDFLFRASASTLDPELDRLIQLEDQRQQEKIILVASESIAPRAVRELMSTNFANVYAEGYPTQSSRRQSINEILDFEAELANYRRFSDPRYYKGVEYADILEALTRRRAAELFAANGVSADELYVNVQPLSGSPANSAVFGALAEPGDTILGLDLNHGGHLTHGSPVSRSGKIYNAVPYTLDLSTERLDYDAIEALAVKANPKIIIAGFTAYPLTVDWHRFRHIADKCGAYLMADIAHISGLVAASVHPSPIGIADVVTTTTHKSLCGPRGAMILTHLPAISSRVDRSVFPGEQGGPHLNTIAALAMALKLAKSERFRSLQQRIVKNAAHLAEELEMAGLRIVSGGTETHLLMVDTKSVQHDGVNLSGDMAARILDVAGIVVNRNTIPGDKSAFASSGIRLGTVWVSQLGYGDDEISQLAQAISLVLRSCRPFVYEASGGRQLKRAKVEPDALSEARTIVRSLSKSDSHTIMGNTLAIRGNSSAEFLDFALSNNASQLAAGESQLTQLFGHDFELTGILQKSGEDKFQLTLANVGAARRAALWLRDLSDGYVSFDEDLQRKLPGPIVVEPGEHDLQLDTGSTEGDLKVLEKPYYVGQPDPKERPVGLPKFECSEQDSEPLQQTVLHSTHIDLGGRMVPFAGWDMPVWYSSVSDEHEAVRERAGLFDVSHMGVLDVSGRNAQQFLNLVTTNDVRKLDIGQSHYTFLLDPSGGVIDDLLVYRIRRDRYLLVVNAANNRKDWAWLNAVNRGEVQIDTARPWVKIPYEAELRDLRDPRWQEECRVDLAIQGPASKEILLSLADDKTEGKIRQLKWSELALIRLKGIDVILSRTGYTGERVAYELFVHPDKSVELWSTLLDIGRQFGLLPCGLAARDSTRTEAGLPLYGHELAGPLGLSPREAGFGNYVKMWKPFFIGRASYREQLAQEDRKVIRFRMDEKGVRRPELGDPVIDRRGKVIGTVTSCAIDSEGFLTGQAVVPPSHAEVGSALEILQLSGGRRSLRIPGEIVLGSRIPTPDRATVVSRFFKR